MPPKVDRNCYQAGLILHAGSCWIGVHWAKHTRRLCINFLPMVTLYIVLPGGAAPIDVLCSVKADFSHKGLASYL